MLNDLDDLFRQELDGHASEPGADLWARLQARTPAGADPAADAHPVDAQFRAGLAGHAPPPRRELWERLEDEHLRPRQRRRPVVAWGRLAVAASLLLLVLAGGAGLWRSLRGLARGPVAATGINASQAPATTGPARADTSPAGTTSAAIAVAPATDATKPRSATHHTAGQPANGARHRAGTPLLAAETVRHQKNRKIYSPQATGFGASPSSSPVARTAALRRPATAQRPVPGPPATASQPDAATGTRLAQGERTPLGGQPATTQPAAAALAAASPQVIEVEVRRGTPARPPADAVAAVPQAPAAAAPRRRFRLGGVLREAGHALRGEPVSLAEATGLPESLTLQARLGDRVVAKTIRL